MQKNKNKKQEEKENCFQNFGEKGTDISLPEISFFFSMSSFFWRKNSFFRSSIKAITQTISPNFCDNLRHISYEIRGYSTPQSTDMYQLFSFVDAPGILAPT